jgi:hypothetical protein
LYRGWSISTKVDKATAICCDYSGIEILRVEVFDSSNPVFFVPLKHHDHAEIIKEMGDETQPVLLPPLLRSIKKIDGLLELAKKDGVWQKKRES